MKINDICIGRIIGLEGLKITVEVTTEYDIKKLYIQSDYRDHLVAMHKFVYAMLPDMRMVIARITKIFDKDLFKFDNIFKSENSRYIFEAILTAIYDDHSGKLDIGINSFPIIGGNIFTLNYEIQEKIAVVSSEYRLQIGHSFNDSNLLVEANPDILLGKHLGIFGNTGTGKSCTVASLIQGLQSRLNKNGVLQQNIKPKIIIFDANNEYKDAFPEGKYNCKYYSKDELKLPHNALSYSEYVRFFDASAGVQAPVLRQAIEKIKEEALIATEIDAVEKEEGLIAAEIDAVEKEEGLIAAEIDAVEKEEALIAAEIDAVEKEEGTSTEDVEIFVNLKDITSRIEAIIKANSTVDSKENTFHYGQWKQWLAPLINRIDRITENDELMEIINTNVNIVDQVINDEAEISIIDVDFDRAELDIIIFLFCKLLYKMSISRQGSKHVVLVLEEAHRYINQDDANSYKLGNYYTERLAREGRKFGVSLIISSQRPSELSTTVLSQCNSYIIHRINNKSDLDFLSKVIKVENSDLLRIIPGLERQYAVVTGEAFRSSDIVRIHDADPVPQSKDPEVIDSWLKKAETDTQPDESFVKVNPVAQPPVIEPECGFSESKMTDNTSHDEGDLPF